MDREQLLLLQQLKQQQAQYQQQMAQQKKPEPIYDLPIHNKSPLQQEQIRLVFILILFYFGILGKLRTLVHKYL